MRRHVLDHLQGPDLPALSAVLQRFAAGMLALPSTEPDTADDHHWMTDAQPHPASEAP